MANLWKTLALSFLFIVGLGTLIAGCGSARELARGRFIGPSVGGVLPGTIYTVKMVVAPTSTGSIPTWVYPGTNPQNNPANSYPLNQALIDFNNPVFIDKQTPFQFTFVYPPNNFKIADAHLVLDTQRDGSDTEGIFVDGVLTGRLPTTMVNNSSPNTLHHHWVGNPGANPVNNYFMDFSLTHYKQNTVNTFDLDMKLLLDQSPLSILDVLQDGVLNIVTGDDSPIYQAYLVINGYTISSSPLNCSTSSTFNFENHYLHNDGNSIGQTAFSGTTETPFQSWTSGAADALEFFFESQLPLVDTENIDLSTATITMNVRRVAGLSAIVVNGVGVAEAGFDTTTATSAVEQWETGASRVAYWNSVLAGIPATDTPTAVTIDLRQLLGAAATRDLLAQGNFNIAISGGIKRIQASGNTSARGFGSPVSGPELNLLGTYFTQVCEVPSNPDSPLEDGPIEPPDPSDTTPPEIVSAQASEISSSSAVIQWLTNEGANTQVEYGIGSLNQSTAVENTPKVFHRVELSGLQPYKFYFFRILSADQNGNQAQSNTLVFRTLR